MSAYVALDRIWHSSLRDLLSSAREQVLVAAPFISQEGSRLFSETVSARVKNTGCLNVITDLSPAHVCDGSLEPKALEALVATVPTSGIWHVPRLHAKVYAADASRAIVTSGNLTAGGFYRNREYGIEIRDPGMVQTILTHFDALRTLGARVSREQLSRYSQAASELRETYIQQQKRVDRRAVKMLRDAMQTVEDDLIRIRLAGGAMHTVFAKTIGYLLQKHGAMSTVQIHSYIKELHPDLCDDSIDRVIDGQHFGKKWKHAVRTAQQYLKKKGEATYKEGLWKACE